MSDEVPFPKEPERVSKEDKSKETKTKLQFLEDRLRHHIDDYKEKRNYNRIATRRIRMSSIILGGVTTTLLGIKSYKTLAPYEEGITIAALILSAAVTTMTAWETYIDYAWKWVRYRTTLSELYDIRDDLRFDKADGGTIAEAKIIEYFEKLKIIIRVTNQEWMNTRVKSVSSPTSQQAKAR